MLRRVANHFRGSAIGYLALFVALGGTAWALESNSVRSKHIVNGQVKSVDLKDNDVTGADVAEGTLGEVPSAFQATTAQNADHATGADSATNANTLDTLDSTAFARGADGQSFIDRLTFAADPPLGPPTTLFSRGGLTVTARCGLFDPGGGAGQSINVEILATSSVDNTSISTHFGQVGNPSSLTTQDNDFDTGESYAPVPLFSARDTQGTLTYSTPSGTTVAITFQADDANNKSGGAPLGNAKNCLFSGVATTVIAP